VTASAKVTGLDHVVLNVSDTQRAVAWYRDELGLEPLRYDEWQRGEVLFVSMRIDATTIIDLLEAPRTGENVNHFCLVVESGSVEAVAASGRFDVVDGPDLRWGAQGVANSVYVRDPDGNVIELRSY
jgi:catechol 2,3-dioxygenase-like lactoylglutathione lyase family enzyme